MPRYGTVNIDYLTSFAQREEPGGPMWALNLMKYREHADYADGRETTLTGAQADDVYTPVEQLKRVGSKYVLLAPVVHQLVGDDTRWDRVAVVQYRNRSALLEMGASEEFAQVEAHKDAGMEFTVVMATFPVPGAPVGPPQSGADGDQLLLLQVVADASAPDLADGIDSTRIGRFEVEARFIGDDRTFAQARYDLISPATATELAARDYTHDDNSYVVVVDPTIDDMARSLSDTTQVLF